jgi:hypothetical protein
VTDPAGQEAWEEAWSAGETAGPERTFPPSLLRDPAIRFAWLRTGQEVVAGATLSRAAGAIGIGNVFGLADVVGLTRLAAATWPGLPLVGYEEPAAAETFLGAGFRELGPLRVWLRGLAPQRGSFWP